jgi:hypothetical protein
MGGKNVCCNLKDNTQFLDEIGRASGRRMSQSLAGRFWGLLADVGYSIHKGIGRGGWAS